MDNALMVLLALETPKQVEPEPVDEKEEEHKKHREDMEKMMLNLAKSNVRQETALGEIAGQMSGIAEEVKKSAKKVNELKKPSAYDMDVLRDENGQIYKIEVKAK